MAGDDDSYPVPIESLTCRAQEQGDEVTRDDLSELRSPRLTATMRIYGRRNQRTLKLHGSSFGHSVSTQADQLHLLTRQAGRSVTGASAANERGIGVDRVHSFG